MASSDPSPGRDAGLQPHVTEHGVFYQRPVETPAAALPAIDAAMKPRPRPVPQPAPAPAAPEPAVVSDSRAARLQQAQEALKQGEYERVLQLVPDLNGDSAACRLRIDALANIGGPEVAVDAGADALRRHPLSTALHFRHAVLLSSLGRLDASEQALRRVIYLDRSIAIAHFALGALQWRLRRLEDARRSYRTAARLSTALAPEAELPLADGQTAGALAAAAERHLGAIGGDKEAIPA
jgi:chemotaxis protein methyltransferase CheR